MTRWKIALSFTVALAAAAVYYGKPGSRVASNSAKAHSGHLACRLSPAEKYSFKLHSSAAVLEAGNPTPHQLDLDAVLWWRVVEDRGARGWVVAAELDKVRVDEGAGDSAPAASAALATPFLFQIGTDCRFRDLAFLPATAVETRQKLERLVHSMEVILSPLPAAQWVAQHQDELGISQVGYTVDRSGAEPLLSLRRIRYMSTGLPWIPQFGGRLSIEVVASQGHATLDADGQWLRRLSSSERLRIAVGTRQFSEATTALQLTRIELGDEPSGFAQLDRSKFVVARIATASVSTEPRELPAVAPELLAMDLNAAVADFVSQLSQGRDGLFKATERLASYLAVHPKAIDDLVARIRNGSIDAKLHSALFLALERTGTLAAEKALGAALADHGMSTMNRMRAAAALQDIPKPTVDTARTLIGQARTIGGGAEENQVASAALLALGALSHRSLDKQPELARLARDEIGQRLHGTHAPGELDIALDAVGNSGDKDLAEVVKPYSQDASAEVRAHAAQAYRRMPVATMEPVLADWLGKESEPTVRGAISSALNEGLFTQNQAASSPTIAAAAKQLAVEPDPKVRAALINVLGSAAATDALAKQALIDQFGREPVAELKVLIGHFVGGADLH